MPMSGGFWMRIAIGIEMQMLGGFKLLITGGFHANTQPCRSKTAYTGYELAVPTQSGLLYQAKNG